MQKNGIFVADTHFNVQKPKYSSCCELYTSLFGVKDKNDTIEVDETHICSRRDSRGQMLAGETTGCISRTKEQIAIKIVRRRTKPNCERVVLIIYQYWNKNHDRQLAWLY